MFRFKIDVMGLTLEVDRNQEAAYDNETRSPYAIHKMRIKKEKTHAPEENSQNLHSNGAHQ